jgi:acetyl esterase
MQLSEQVKKVLTYIQSIEIPPGLSLWEAGRVFYEQFIPLSGEKEDVFQVIDKKLINDKNLINLRIYRPNQDKSSPVIIYFHGGWFNSGSLETHDIPLRQLTNLTQATIIAVDYRLAPEYPYPAGMEDGEFAVRWIIENANLLDVDTNKITIAGDSAGAALVISITRKFRTIVHSQLLIYPVTDNSLSTSSWNEFHDGPLLNIEGGIQAWSWYLPNIKDRDNPDAVPLLANDLENIPPTFIAIADYDPLKDEGILYAEKLRSKGISVHLKIYQGMTHGFFQMGGYVEDTKILMQDIAGFVKAQNSL